MLASTSLDEVANSTAHQAKATSLTSAVFLLFLHLGMFTSKALIALHSKKLKQIAERCGWDSTGTKPILANRIHEEAQIARFVTPGTLDTQTKEDRILSIDMGIRNLAICCMLIPKNTASSPSYVKNKSTPSTALPKVIAWERFSVLERAGTLIKTRKASATSSELTLPELLDTKIFQPNVFARLVTSLVQDMLEKHQPSAILIERQRFRTMGSSGVQEWTVRVNMFEAMLHATLTVLIERGIWKNGLVVSISPQKVTNFWLSRITSDDSTAVEEAEPRQRRNKSKKDAKEGLSKLPTRKRKKVTSANSKKLKMQLVAKLMAEKQTVQFDQNSESVLSISKHFESLGIRAKRGTNKVKLDDLADSFLQCLAAFEWEENRKLLLTGDIDLQHKI